MIAARYVPAPLQLRLPANPTQLSGLRRAVRAWTRAAALPAALGEDLQLTLGEAAANAVEHAYASTGEPGEFACRLTHRGDGAIDVEVRDFGRWRPEPTNNRHRGRGLALIRELATDVVIGSSPTGTQVRFRLLAPPPPSPEPSAPTAQAQPTPAAPPAPAELRVHQQPDGGGRGLEHALPLAIEEAVSG
jgi:anti-sigma regulatory factor (Ser/Thr protein kinase)